MHGKGIIEMLKEQNVHLDKKVENTINLIAFEIFSKGEEEGVRRGINIGINKVCKEFEFKISEIKSKND